MFHIRLKKALSYSGIVNATKEKPDLYVDKATAEKAVATGYFELVGKAHDVEGSLEHAGEPAIGRLDRTQLEEMDYNDLKKLAADLGVDTKTIKKKTDLIEAIVAIEVEVPAYDDLTDEEKAEVDAAEAEDSNEVDYGEDDVEGSPTMKKLQEI